MIGLMQAPGASAVAPRRLHRKAMGRGTRDVAFDSLALASLIPINPAKNRIPPGATIADDLGIVVLRGLEDHAVLAHARGGEDCSRLAARVGL